MSRAYIFDVETHAKKEGEIIEAAWIRMLGAADLLGPDDDLIPHEVAGLALAGTAQVQRYRPASAVTFGAMAVHHILPSEIETCPPSKTFALPADCQYLIGHSIDFDWEAAGSPAHVKRICTHAMSEWIWPDDLGHSLGSFMYRILGADAGTRAMLKEAHSAGADCSMTLILLYAILRERPEITRWSQLWNFSEECRIPRTCPMKRYEGVLLEELDEGFVGWCLNQEWLDPYFRKGLERVVEKRYGVSVDDDGIPY